MQKSIVICLVETIIPAQDSNDGPKCRRFCRSNLVQLSLAEEAGEVRRSSEQCMGSPLVCSPVELESPSCDSGLS